MKQKIMIRKVKDFLLRRFTQFYGWFHPIKKQILFSSYVGYLYADSGREIAEQLHRLFPQYDLVWLLADKPDIYHIIPDYITKIVVKDKFTFYKQLAQSFCFISNEAFTPNMYKRSGQLFIQTWHGDRPFKKVLYEEKLPLNALPCQVADYMLADFCVAGSDKGTIQYREAFRYQGPIVQQGMPRNDKLINQQFDACTIKKRLHLPPDCKVLLYAPTFRDYIAGKQQMMVDLSRTLNVLAQKYPGNTWIGLIRAHSCSAGFQGQTNNARLINVSDYPDMTDLLCITDVLLTDYSSCAGDFVLTHKPVILTIFDSADYQEKCRSFKYPLEKTGFILAHNQEELEQEIRSLTEEKIQSHYEQVMKFFGITETGKSAEVICQKIDAFYKANFKN